MNRIGLTIIALSTLVLFCDSALAQRPGPEFRRPLACEPLEPRTNLKQLNRDMKE